MAARSTLMDHCTAPPVFDSEIRSIKPVFRRIRQTGYGRIEIFTCQVPTSITDARAGQQLGVKLTQPSSSRRPLLDDLQRQHRRPDQQKASFFLIFKGATSMKWRL